MDTFKEKAAEILEPPMIKPMVIERIKINLGICERQASRLQHKTGITEEDKEEMFWLNGAADAYERCLILMEVYDGREDDR